VWIIGQTKAICKEATGNSRRRRNIMDLQKSYKNWRAYRNTVAELSQLSDRDLSDMGVARGDIYAVARKATR
jgi:uncharacterized protein YjiS (DUF1127 family)